MGGRIILKWILKYDVRMQNDLIRLRMGSIGGVL
jgi:hypothetical protein